ncbi:hypothetical protein DDN99_18015, partial [Vibrio cholerae]|nr:hypothetical protein [Vibrio cholerae]
MVSVVVLESIVKRCQPLRRALEANKSFEDMRYFIKQMILGATVAIPIDFKEFKQLMHSKSVLYSAKAIEETYDLLVQNYLEFEQEILSILTRQMIVVEDGYDDSYDIQSSLNRRVVNLLTSTKLYYDHIEKHVRTCMGNDESEGSRAKSFFSLEYDNNVEYRFMEALRNYVQHYGLAIHSMSLNSNWVGEGDHEQLVNKLRLYTLKNELALDKTFKKQILKELDDKTELIKAIRVYVGSLSNVHDKVRTQIQMNVGQARDNVSKAICKYEKSGGNALGCYAYSVPNDDPTDTPIEKYALMLDWDDVRLKLERRNQALPRLSRWYVSGSC